MLVSFNWLREFVAVDQSAEEIAELLTMGGLEVEGVTHVGQGLEKVLTAKIEEITPHPSSKKLSLTRISLGDREETVVCGAPNIAVGQIVPYAPPGAVLPSGMEMEAREIHGVLSPGMICSEKELDLGEDASGILVFSDDVELGLPLAEAMPYIEDALLEAGITPNRGDCLSIIGAAREVAALTGCALKVPQFEMEESDTKIAKKIKIEVPDLDLCPRYVVRLVEGVTIEPSPFAIRLKLSRSGIRPISNIVDVTNLVLMECGQPLHAFDYELLKGKKIVVRRAQPDETFVTLDGEERKMPADALMIRDGRRSVALAGIMGGLNSEIHDDTSDVLIESACFERFGIRRTAKAMGMSTEASFRFERGVDPDGTLWAAHRSAYLMAQVAGGSVADGVVDVYPEPIERPPVKVTAGKINAVLGAEIACNDMVTFLKRLGIRVDQDKNETLICTPPSWRWDLEKPEDIVEEVARVYGFQNIPISTPRYRSAPDGTREHYNLQRRVAGLMTASGYSEVVTMSFVSQAAAKEFSGHEENYRQLALINPLTEDHVVMRPSLVSGLLGALKRNVSFRSTDLKLFELGKTFTPIEGEELPREDLKLGAVATGARYADLWNVNREDMSDFYDLKGSLENLVEGLGSGPIRFIRSDLPFLHPGKSAQVLFEDNPIGFIGEIGPHKLREHDLDAPVQIFEILLEPLLVYSRKQRVFRPIARYPYIERDLSIIIEEKVSSDEIKHLISRLAHDIIQSVIVFDLYRGKTIPEGKQSIAFRIRYQSEDRTLTDDEVQEVHSQIVATLINETGASLRE